MSFGMQVKVSVVGDSYIWRLLKYIDDKRAADILGKYDRAFNLYKEDVEITYDHKSGGLFDDLRKLAKKRVMKGDVDILVMMAGGNDIDMGIVDNKQLADDIFELALDLIEADIVKFVLLTQIINREKPRNLTRNQYRQKAEEFIGKINELSQFHPRIIFWRHDRMRTGRPMHEDGVHLNCVGHYLLYNSLKKALAHLFDHLSRSEECQCDGGRQITKSRKKERR